MTTAGEPESPWAAPSHGLQISTVAPLVDALADSSQRVRLAALEALVQLPLDQEAWIVVAGVVLEALGDPAQGGVAGAERAGVIASAGRVPTLQVRRRLVELLQDGSEKERSAALTALVAARDPAAVDPLVIRVHKGDTTAAPLLARVGAAPGQLVGLSDSGDLDLRFWLGLAEARAGAPEVLAAALREYQHTGSHPSIARPVSMAFDEFAPVAPLGVELHDTLRGLRSELAAANPWPEVIKVVDHLLVADGLVLRPPADLGVAPVPEADLVKRRRAADELAALVISSEYPEKVLRAASAPTDPVRWGALVGALFAGLVGSAFPGHGLLFGNLITRLASAQPFVPDLSRLYDTYARTITTGVRRDPSIQPLRGQIAWAVSRSTVPAIVAAAAQQQGLSDPLGRLSALHLLTDAMSYRSWPHGPVFGGGASAGVGSAAVGLIDDTPVASAGPATARDNVIAPELPNPAAAPPTPPPGRRATSWLIDPPSRLTVGAKVVVGFEIAPPRAHALASVPAAEPDWHGQDGVELFVVLLADTAEVQPPGQSLTLPRTGASATLRFEVVPQAEGDLVLRFRVHLHRRGNLLQELTAHLPIVAGVSAGVP